MARAVVGPFGSVDVTSKEIQSCVTNLCGGSTLSPAPPRFGVPFGSRPRNTSFFFSLLLRCRPDFHVVACNDCSVGVETRHGPGATQILALHICPRSTTTRIPFRRKSISNLINRPGMRRRLVQPPVSSVSQDSDDRLQLSSAG